jgi:DNA-binding transcriptional MerR regulator
MPESDTALPGKLYFRIGEVAELVGVEPHVLRYWETEFRMRPHRSSSGHRLYRKKDIQRFLRIRKLLHTEGFTIAGARKALTESTVSGGPGVGVDLEKLREAAVRIEGLQHQLQGLRVEVLAGPFVRQDDEAD